MLRSRVGRLEQEWRGRHDAEDGRDVDDGATAPSEPQIPRCSHQQQRVLYHT